MTIKVAKSRYNFRACFCSALLLMSAVFALCGCQSDRYYQARAAEKAREFLISNAPELSPDQVSFVKYNEPVLLVGKGLKGQERGTRQICVTWDIPGCRSLYMVFGAGRTRMDDWYPNRLIRKDFVTPAGEINAAISMCRSYAVTNFYEVLSKADLNTVRLSNPEIVETSFEPRPDAEGKVPEGIQISLQWKISEHRYAVFCGYSSKADLKGWQINFAGMMPDYEANFVRGKVLKTPEDYNTPILPPEEKAPEQPEVKPEENTGPAAEQKKEQ